VDEETAPPEETDMAELPSHPGTDDDPAVGSGRDAPPAGRPRWVPVAGIVITIVLVLVIIVLHLTGTLGPGGH
jgi:hypothetical protein